MCVCRVITWEPIPQFRAFLEYNRQLNRLEHLIEIRDTAVADISGVTYDLKVPSKGIWGTAGIGGLNIDRSGVQVWCSAADVLLNVCPSCCHAQSQLLHRLKVNLGHSSNWRARHRQVRGSSLDISMLMLLSITFLLIQQTEW